MLMIDRKRKQTTGREGREGWQRERDIEGATGRERGKGAAGKEK